jgi:hypothetical protein
MDLAVWYASDLGFLIEGLYQVKASMLMQSKVGLHTNAERASLSQKCPHLWCRDDMCACWSVSSMDQVHACTRLEHATVLRLSAKHSNVYACMQGIQMHRR